MKCFGLLLLALPVLAAGAAPEIKFAAVLTVGDATQLRLVEESTGVGQWLPIGGGFFGYSLVSYNPTDESVKLVKDGIELRLGLVASKVREGTSRLTPEGVAAIRANLRLVAVAAKLCFVEGSSHYLTFTDLVGPNKPIKRLISVAGEDYSKLALMKGETRRLTVATLDGAVVVYELAPGKVD